jgi:predicted nuclease of predicted toxin-antitoxin system
VKLLLDACVWGGAKKFLESRGHDVVWAGEWLEDTGDREILKRAHAAAAMTMKMLPLRTAVRFKLRTTIRTFTPP